MWQGGFALAAVLCTLTIGNFVISDERAVGQRTLGHDFIAFYAAGTFVRTGEFNKLYDLEETKRFEHDLATANKLEIGKSFGPYWNPPFYAWLPSLFARLPYQQALLSWTLMNLACLSVAMVLMVKMLPPEHSRHWKTWALVPLLIITSMPFIQAISHGQNTFMSLMLLSLVVTAWRKQLPVAAGLVCGLMFYKPQLAAVVAGMLVLTLGVRVLLGLGFVGGILLMVTTLYMPDTLANYLAQLPLNLRYMQIDNPYLWERHVTLRGFWRLLYQGREAGETLVLVQALTMLGMAIIGAGLLLACRRTRERGFDDCWTGETRAIARDRLISATIVSMPLLMPFYFDYDLLLLSVPAVLLAGEVMLLAPRLETDWVRRRLVGIWIALYLWLMFNPPVASAGGINMSVVLVATISGLSIARACVRGEAVPPILLPQMPEHATRRAA